MDIQFETSGDITLKSRPNRTEKSLVYTRDLKLQRERNKNRSGNRVKNCIKIFLCKRSFKPPILLSVNEDFPVAAIISKEVQTSPAKAAIFFPLAFSILLDAIQ